VIHILDTNAVSALMRGDTRAIDRLGALAAADVQVPEPVFAEIAYGIERLPRSRRKAALRDRLVLVRAELATAAWTPAVSDAFGTIKAGLERAGRRIEDFDAAVAAHALAIGATLVTANVKHMLRVSGLTVVDWSTPD
jgi:tRNA(fMet)-specific endonuclease VapC